MNVEHELPQSFNIEEIAGIPVPSGLTNRQKLKLSAYDIRIESLTIKIDNYKRGATWKERWATIEREDKEKRDAEIGWGRG